MQCCEGILESLSIALEGRQEELFTLFHMLGEPLRSVEEPAGFFPSAVLVILCPLSVPARRGPGENGRTDSAESQH